MTEEVIEAVSTAPETGGTAAPDSAPVGGEQKPEGQPERVFTQAELDAEIGKRLARAERKAAREREQAIAQALAKASPPPQPQPAGKPQPENFKTTEEYIEAVASYQADQIFQKRVAELSKSQTENQRRQEVESRVQGFQQREEEAIRKYGDYEDVVRDPTLPISDAMAETIQASDQGPEVAYYLGKNRAEAERISKLSPFLQAKELGKIEAKLASVAPPPKPSSAPPPIRPVAGGKGSQPVFDTTDPRSTKTMTTSEWIAAERKRQEAKWKAEGRI